MPSNIQRRDNGQPAAADLPANDCVVPLSIGALREVAIVKGHPEAGTGKASDIVFRPGTLARAETDMGFKLFLVELALQHLENDHKFRLHRQYKFGDVPYFGEGEKPPAQHTEEELAAMRQAKAGKGPKKKQNRVGRAESRRPTKQRQEDITRQLASVNGHINELHSEGGSLANYCKKKL